MRPELGRKEEAREYSSDDDQSYSHDYIPHSKVKKCALKKTKIAHYRIVGILGCFVEKYEVAEGALGQDEGHHSNAKQPKEKTPFEREERRCENRRKRGK